MKAWKSHFATVSLTGLAMAGIIAAKLVAPTRPAEGGATVVAADPVETGSLPARRTADAQTRPRRFQPSNFSAGEVRPPAPATVTRSLRFTVPERSDSVVPPAGRFGGSTGVEAATAGETASASGAVRGRPPVRTAGLLPPVGTAPGADAAEPRLRDTPFSQVEVTDGRSFTASGRRIRLAGIRIPAPDRTCRMLDGTPDTCGGRARTHLELFLRNRPVLCALPAEPAKGAVETRCRVGAVDLSEWMVRSGWAEPAGEPDAALTRAAAEARRRRVGLWRGA
ncbi:thermonuclease family protein [Prosthecodimorpha staleyi]|uniref:TNase-like domain-containing protein n=1 Tax=Prosthecodimorpha staleyi TaxID=2840188 RepID=A0A947D928_9HYPH|nr:hypothetical protein [Prosthecodimorpha staleyi]MBT9292314.1 hypothetical protein [Prosthecodimorpha staleyi]